MSENTPRMYPVDASRMSVPLSAEAQARELAEAREKLFGMLPPELAAVVRRDYAEETGARVVAVPGNEALSDQFARVYALEDAIQEGEFDAFQRRMVFERSTKVIIAVLDSLKIRDANVVMLRTTVDDLARNFILVRRDALSAEAIASGLSAIETSRRRIGEIPTEEITIVVDSLGARRPPLAPKSSNQLAEVMAGFASAPPAAIPGYGLVPAVTITVGPVAADQRTP